MEFKDLSLIEIIEKIKSSETNKKEVFDYFLKRIEKYNKKLNIYNYVNKEGISERTNESELAGIPIAIKDIFCEKGIKTTGASKILKDFIPPYDSTIIKKLKDAGMSSIGKVNMDEFAMGSSGENSAFKSTISPWGNNRVPGGSSSGSAAVVAAGLAPASLGTDTGGSIRQPASLCGVVGFKPSYGRNSRQGISAMASSLDCPGTFTKTVKDAAMLYEIMNGEDDSDNTSIEKKDRIDNKIWHKKDFSGVKVGVPKQYFEEGLDVGVKEVIEKAIEDIKNTGAEIVEIDLPMTKYAVATYYILMPAEVSTNLARLDGIRYGLNANKAYDSMDELYINNRTEGFGEEVKRRIILGSYVLSAGYYDSYYKKAAKVRTLIIKDFEKAFEKCNIIVGPVSPSVAWKIGEKDDDPLKMYLSDSYTIPSSLAGLPAMSVPAGLAKSQDKEKEELPVGLHIIAPQLQEQKMFELANIYEKITNHNKYNPENF